MPPHNLVLLILVLSQSALGAPIDDQTGATRTLSSAAASSAGHTSLSRPPAAKGAAVSGDDIVLAPGQADDTAGISFDFSNIPIPEPIRGTKGGTDPGPKQPGIDRTHPDILAPPQSDHGGVPQLNWPMDLSYTKLGLNRAGFSRQENLKVLPAAKQFAGVDMRLEAGAYRELHWHTSGEWAFILDGSARVSAVNEKGETFIDDLSEGDVWFFPPGIPHYIQGLENGTEFLLIFDDGNFSEEETFLVTEMFARTPTEVWSKEFDLPPEAFAKIPPGGLFIFNGTQAPKNVADQAVTGPVGAIPEGQGFSFHWSEKEAQNVPGGSIKILDTGSFPIASDFSTALVTVKPGAIREIHWHPSSDEWSYFIQGNARMSVYVAPGNGRTFDFNPGDVGYVPRPCSHYIENIGTEDVIFLEVLKQKIFTDVSVGQWWVAGVRLLIC